MISPIRQCFSQQALLHLSKKSFSILVLLSCLRGITARPIDARELLVGRWNATLSPILSPGNTDDECVTTSPLSKLILSEKQRAPNNGRRRFFWRTATYPATTPSKVQCQLLFHPNRTFTLTTCGTGATMKGAWYIHRNPYCPTDRFFDEVVLQTGDNNHHAVFCRCRLQGHFSNAQHHWRRQHRCFARARLSHGIWKDDHAQQQLQARFAAQRWIPEEHTIDEEYHDATDLEIFGY